MSYFYFFSVTLTMYLNEMHPFFSISDSSSVSGLSGLVRVTVRGNVALIESN